MLRKKPKQRSRLAGEDGSLLEEERAAHERWGLRPAYWLLLAIVVLAVMATLRWPEGSVLGRFAPNLATDTFGILLTLVFVQRFLDQQDRARRLRASVGGLRKATRAIVRVNQAWRAVIKGSLPQAPEIPPGTLRALYAPHLTEHLLELDPTLLRDPESGEDETWVQWLVGELHALQDTLRTVIVAYGPSLDPEYVEALDDVVDDRFIASLNELAASGIEAAQWRVTLNRLRGFREEHFARLTRLVEIHNLLAGDAAKLRSRRSVPRSGTIGLALAPDADIRVPEVIERRLWHSPPGAGTLRSDQRLAD